jgi:hypothetical protein
MTTHAIKTPIPPGIEMPNEVQTRLGTLRFFDGFPDDATTQTLFDNLDFQRAVQAYLLALPPVDQAAQRRWLSRWEPANSTMVIFEDLIHPRTLIWDANTSTTYSVMWVDLHDGPVVLEAPPGVYGIISDFWGRWVADIGRTGADKGQGGKYLLLPPGYDGEVPDGYFLVRPPTYGNLLFFRGFRDEHGDPHPAVEVIKANTRVYPLAQAGDPPPLRFVNVSPEPYVVEPPGDYQFWDLLNEVVQSEPPESSDPITLGMFAAIGIQHGKPFAPDERMRAILTEAATVGDATARAITYRFRPPEAYYYPDSAWRNILFGGYRFQDHGAALFDAATQLYFCGGAASPANELKIVGAGSQYLTAFVDATGATLDGGRSYRLHVPAHVPVKDFWSILVYDTQTRSMVQTDQEFPSVTSEDRGLTTNSDGSVDVYFGPEPPPDGHNWIQTLPGKGWWAMFRVYGPLEPWFDKTWRLPEIEPAT